MKPSTWAHRADGSAPPCRSQTGDWIEAFATVRPAFTRRSFRSRSDAKRASRGARVKTNSRRDGHPRCWFGLEGVDAQEACCDCLIRCPTGGRQPCRRCVCMRRHD
jgi:hypothetical protein